MSTELDNRLNKSKELLAEIARRGAAEHRWAVDAVMSDVAHVGALLQREPELAKAEPISSFLEQARAMRNQLLVAADIYLRATSRILRGPWQHEEWFEACHRRSAVEFLRSLLSVPPDDDPLDTEAVDELIRERGDTEGVLPASGVDPGIPPAHWWWWYPNEPKATL